MTNIADDLIMNRKGLKVSQSLEEYDLTLDAYECHFQVPKLTFFGHDFSQSGVTPS